VWGNLVALALIVAVIGGALWLSAMGTESGQRGVIQEIDQPAEGAAAARIVVEPGIGALQIAAQPESGNLVVGRVSLERNEELQREFAVTEGLATFDLRTQGAGTMMVPLVGSWWDRRLWDLQLSRDASLELEFRLGAGQHRLDLTGLTVEGLTVSMGLGRTEIILPAEGRFQGQIEGAIGETVLVAPSGMALRVQVETGLGDSRFPEDYRCLEDVCTSPGYADADQRIDLQVSQAIGVVTVRQP